MTSQSYTLTSGKAKQHRLLWCMKCSPLGLRLHPQVTSRPSQMRNSKEAIQAESTHLQNDFCKQTLVHREKRGRRDQYKITTETNHSKGEETALLIKTIKEQHCYHPLARPWVLPQRTHHCNRSGI